MEDEWEVQSNESSILQIALAILCKEVTFIIGTGMSRCLTSNSAPSWLELLYALTIEVENKAVNDLSESLFEPESLVEKRPVLKKDVDTFVAAQIIENAYDSFQKDSFRDTIAGIIRKRTSGDSLDRENINIIQEFFNEMYPDKKDINIITTNYDALLESDIFKEANTYSSQATKKYVGLNRANIYHIHGVIDTPKTITITMK